MAKLPEEIREYTQRKIDDYGGGAHAKASEAERLKREIKALEAERQAVEEQEAEWREKARSLSAWLAAQEQEES